MDEFQFDQAKSRANLEKHGIDFETAQALWEDPNLLEIRARSEGEPRFLLIGKIAGRHWSAVVTYREGRTRLISVRRSRRKEVELYES
ncbi:BrnT family toxin [Thioalkalivibrio sp. ALJ2]|uniref:BrnT family toxin n=1 Tax=Thioalkalivibrio sp. ALJ2 TaxID=1261622 RepID=UPI00047799AF|nr:BrnT family toxin [Thioalkalivibrio sp. ALJ2]